MRKLALGIIAIFAVVALLAVVAVKVRSEPTSGSVAIIALTPDQAKALRQVDDLLANLKKQFEDTQSQRGALITGFALSNSKTSGAGLEWGKQYQFEQAANGEWGFRELSSEERQARAAQQTPSR